MTKLDELQPARSSMQISEWDGLVAKNRAKSTISVGSRPSACFGNDQGRQCDCSYFCKHNPQWTTGVSSQRLKLEATTAMPGTIPAIPCMSPCALTPEEFKEIYYRAMEELKQ